MSAQVIFFAFLKGVAERDEKSKERLKFRTRPDDLGFPLGAGICNLLVVQFGFFACLSELAPSFADPFKLIAASARNIFLKQKEVVGHQP